MRIAVVNVTSGGLSGGYRKYLQQVIPRLTADSRIEHIHLFIPAASLAAYTRLRDSPRISLERLPSATGQLRERIAAIRPDVVFIPTARWLNCGDTPVVTMVRNMEPLSRPFAGNAVADKLTNAARAWTAWRAVRRAERVIAVSQYVRDFLVTRWHVRASKIGTVYHGVEPAGTIESRAPSLTIQPGVPMLFTAGSIRPSRGLEDLIEAVGHLKHTGTRLSVVVAGQPDRHTNSYREHLLSLAKRASVEEDIVWAGQLVEAEMAWCFERADVFVMTTRAEACPNLALESMSHGCIAIAGDHPPMPEIFDNTAIYYRAGDSRALAARIRESLDALRSRATFRETARRRAALFDWQKTAALTVDELVRAAGAARDNP